MKMKINQNKNNFKRKKIKIKINLGWMYKWVYNKKEVHIISIILAMLIKIIINDTLKYSDILKNILIKQ